MVSDLSTELGITSATVISIADVQNRMYGDILDIKTSQDSTKIDIAAIRTEIENINIMMQNYLRMIHLLTLTKQVLVNSLNLQLNLEK